MNQTREQQADRIIKGLRESQFGDRGITLIRGADDDVQSAREASVNGNKGWARINKKDFFEVLINYAEPGLTMVCVDCDKHDIPFIGNGYYRIIRKEQEHE